MQPLFSSRCDHTLGILFTWGYRGLANPPLGLCVKCCINVEHLFILVKVSEGAGTEDANEGIEFQYGEDSDDEDGDNIDTVSYLFSFIF